MTKRSPSVIEFARSGFILREVFKTVSENVCPGISTKAVDAIAQEKILSLGGQPAFLGYDGFPAACCISINEEVVHCVPSCRKLEFGDIVSVDCGVVFEGVYTDACRTYAVGGVSPNKRRLLSVVEDSLQAGIAAAVPGNHIGDISYEIQRTAELAGFNVSREFVGHGIGESLHMLPWIPNYGRKSTGVVIRAGMCLAIEPIIFEGSWKTFLLGSGGVVSKSGALSAHVEDTVFIGPEGPINVTR